MRWLVVMLVAGCGVEETPAMDDLAAPGDAGIAHDLAGPCPEQMALVDVPDAGRVCVDRYEGALMEAADGGERLYPHYLTAGGKANLRAVPAMGVKPQGYISQVESAAACQRSGKRLCTLAEWMAACQGPAGFTYPYGNTYEAGACNEGRATNPVNDCFGTGNVFTSKNMNDPCCDMQPNGIAAGGAFSRCVSPWGVYDLHGNRHEWVEATTVAGNGIFKGGFFVDAKLNGPGCTYRTTAHAKSYHDYSTGFRCCADARK